MRKINSAWEFIGRNFVSLATVIAGVTAIIAVRLDLIESTAIPAVTLALVCLLATSEIVEKSKKLQQLQTSVDEGLTGLADQLGVKRITKLGSSADAHRYMATAVLRATRSISHAALGRGYARSRSPQKEQFHTAIDDVIGRGTVNVTYVTAFYDRFRWERVSRWLDKPNISKFYVGHYSAVTIAPLVGAATLYFLIIDESEVIVRLPKPIGENEEYLSLNDPLLVELFVGYFRMLWTGSEKISERSYDPEKMAAIGRALQGS